MASSNRIITLIPILIILLFFLVACTNIETEKATQRIIQDTTQISTSTTNYPWAITIINWEIADNLKGTDSAMQYNGDLTQIEINEIPTEGNTFLLIDLSIDKQKTGAATFIWKNFYILDETGNKYYRHPNDTFLEKFNLPRIKSIDLTIGKNRGFVCLEIPKSIINEKLVIVYNSPEGELKIPMN